MTAKVITLANLAESTAQEVYDFVKEKLLGQNKKSVNESGKCLYRGADGARCAAGFIIGDDWRPEFESFIWENLASKGAVPTAHRELIDALQRVHDTIGISFWPEHLERVAARFNLNP